MNKIYIIWATVLVLVLGACSLESVGNEDIITSADAETFEPDDPAEMKPEGQFNIEEAFPETSGEIREGYAKINGEVRYISYEHVEGLNVYEGDILIPDSDLVSGTVIEGISFSHVYTSRKWKNNTVYYQIGNVHKKNKKLIQKAIAHWEAHTSLVFVNEKSSSYIEFVRSKGNSSYVGRIGGKQELKLSYWASKGTIIHEIGHAIGLEHEQTRDDRDDYVVIKWKNIKKGKEHNFDQDVYRAPHNRDIGEFDFDSIMLYDSWSFSKNLFPTMKKKNGGLIFAQRKYLSSGDIAGVEYLYGE